jgi:hypothetical protein
MKINFNHDIIRFGPLTIQLHSVVERDTKNLAAVTLIEEYGGDGFIRNWRIALTIISLGLKIGIFGGHRIVRTLLKENTPADVAVHIVEQSSRLLEGAHE